MDKKTLIEKMTPLYNSYKDQKVTLRPVEALEIMWDIGALIEKFLKEHKIKPHALYREIYGKSEGGENIAQKSYITREFQGRCFRIRKMFVDKDQIRKEFPHLNNFTAFREAMPFLDNPKYAFKGEEREGLIKLLNSGLKPSTLFKKIKELQGQRINKKNPRTQRLSDLDSVKQNFIALYNYAYKLISLKSYDSAVSAMNHIPPETIKSFARVTASLCQDGLKLVKFTAPSQLDQVWMNYYEDINRLINQEDPKERRRFRRVMPPARIIRLTDMLYALADEQIYKNFR